jgi:hypothetical protein
MLPAKTGIHGVDVTNPEWLRVARLQGATVEVPVTSTSLLP